MADRPAWAEDTAGAPYWAKDTPAPPEAPIAKPDPSTTEVFGNALWKGAAGVPDTLLNAPNRLLNLGKAGVGTAATAAGHPELAPDLRSDPDIIRTLFEKAGLIKPGVEPSGPVQKALDVLTQGAVGGAITGGAGLGAKALGAGMGALSSGAGAATEAATGSPALGAAAGVAVPGGVGKIAGGGRKLSPDVAKLAKEGVQMTPGQIMGGAVKNLEDSATSMPVLSTAIKSAQRRGHESFDAGAFNRALAPVGEKLPDGVTGHKAVAHVERILGERYDELLSKSKGNLYSSGQQGSTMPTVPGSPAAAALSLDAELTNLRAMAVAGNMPPAQLSELDGILHNEIRGRFTKHGLASGETVKEVDSYLGQMAKKKELSSNYHDNQLAGAIKEARAAITRMLDRENPQHAGEKQKIDEGWANFKRVQSAASNVGASEGVFTPAQLVRAVKSTGKTRDNASFARGGALMQDYAEAGKEVLSSSVPDSGSPLRLAWQQLNKHPFLGTAGAVASAAYHPAVQKVLQKMLASDNPKIREAAKRAMIPLSVTENDNGRQ